MARKLIEAPDLTKREIAIPQKQTKDLELSQALQVLNAKIQQAESLKAVLESEVSSIRKILANRAQDIESVKKTLQVELSLIRRDTDKLKTSIGMLETSKETKIANLTSEQEQLDGELQEVKTKVNQVEKKTAETIVILSTFAGGDLDTTEGTIAKLKKDVQWLLDEVDRINNLRIKEKKLQTTYMVNEGMTSSQKANLDELSGGGTTALHSHTGGGVTDHGDLTGLSDDDHTQYVNKTLYDAYSILFADTDDIPTALTLAASTIPARLASGGIVAATPAQILAILTGQAGAAFSWNGQDLTSVGHITIGAKSLKFTSHLFRQQDTYQVYLRNIGDTAFTQLQAAGFIIGTPGGELNIISTGGIRVASTDGGYIVFKARNTGVSNDEVARLQGAADPYFQATVPMVLLPIATASLPATPVEGMIAYDDTLNKFVVYTGAAWIPWVVAADLPTQYTDALAKAAAVQSGAITDGVTLAPTHDAVYDVKVTADAAQPASTDDADAVAAVNAAGLLLADTKNIEFDPTPAASHTANGIIVTMTAGTALVFGDACYVGTDGKMEKALADDAAVTIPATHLCIATIAENAAGLFLVNGWAHDDSWAFDVGLSVYLSAATAGLITKTMPTKVTGNQVQVLGTCLVADTIMWSPSMIVMEYA